MSYTLSFVSPEGENIGSNAVESLDDFEYAIVNDGFGENHRIEIEDEKHAVCRDCYDSDDCPCAVYAKNRLWRGGILRFD